MKNSYTSQLLWLMSDWEWHSNLEINNQVGWRFWWYLHRLRKIWCIFEKKWWQGLDKQYIEYWKLIFVPYELQIKNGRIKSNIKKWPQEVKLWFWITYSQDKPKTFKNLFWLLN